MSAAITEISMNGEIEIQFSEPVVVLNPQTLNLTLHVRLRQEDGREKEAAIKDLELEWFTDRIFKYKVTFMNPKNISSYEIDQLCI